MARVNFKNFTPRPKPRKRPRRHKKNLNKAEKIMPRYHNINGNIVQFTAEEEAARDAEEQA